MENQPESPSSYQLVHPDLLPSFTKRKYRKQRGVSILMPLYNGVEFLQDSIPSVLQQTWSGRKEILLAVNGYEETDDAVYREALKWSSTDDSSVTVRVLNFPLSTGIRGKSATLNEMLKHCLYDYVAILDVDDVWLPTKLEKQMVYLMEEDYSVVGTKCVYFGDPHLAGRSPDIPTGDIGSFDFFRFNPIINSSVVLLKSLCYWRTDCPMGIEDYDLWLRLWMSNRESVKKGYSLLRFRNIDEILVQHRIHPQSAFNSKGNANGVRQLLEEYAKQMV